MALLPRALAPGILLGVLGWAVPAAAQATAVAPYRGPHREPEPGCFPACRFGYVCARGRCISKCNPPCPPDQVCVGGKYCELRPSEPAPYEPPPPPQKGFAERSHFALAFHLGFAGGTEVNGAESDLGTTLGFNFRTDVPVVRYLLIGPLFQFGAWRPDLPGPAPTRNYYLDVDLFVRGRIPIEVDPINLQFWGGLPIGLTLHFLGEDQAQALESFGIGWNVGVLFGGAVHFTKRFGMFAELGWLQHRASHDRKVGRGSSDFWLGQPNFNVGFVFGN